ncbi:MFS transporter [Ktedonosporobacter rubrisoli]|uniref:MFS transporter n=1 Tax=Ktedonosporobacter rubrisoli TaxID=2509675 RepID=A0A4P6JLV9_KTERU|nr:MFS transporter [Ktedonosporobacter rubrisoli]QBD75982.1 MFS transporter [Ktedonosporobacter rubrisoli]
MSCITDSMTTHEQGAAPRRTLALAALSLGSFMVLLDSTILNVALPALGHDLHASLESFQWVLNSYTLLSASLPFTGGALGDRFGARRLFLIGTVLFTLASLFCSLVPSIELLIIARAAQGIGAALLLPPSLSLIPHLFHNPGERAAAVASQSGIAALAVASGPLVGGILVDSLGWRSVFLVNLLFGLVALTLTLAFIPPTPAQTERKLDLAGQLTIILALCSLTYVLIEWGHISLPLSEMALLLFVATTGAFLAIEARRRHPMLPLQIFSSWSASATTLVSLLYQFSFYGLLFVFALFFQEGFGYSAMQTGLAELPQTAVGAFLLLFVAKRVARWLQPSTSLAIGMALGAIGMLLILLGTHTNFFVIALGEMFVGGCGGFTVAPMTTVMLSSAPKAYAGIASALLSAARSTGGILGVAVLGSILRGQNLSSGIHVTLFILAAAAALGCLLSLSARTKGKSQGV